MRFWFFLDKISRHESVVIDSRARFKFGKQNRMPHTFKNKERGRKKYSLHSKSMHIIIYMLYGKLNGMLKIQIA